MSIVGYIIIPREDSVYILEQLGWKHLFSNDELIELAIENLESEKQDIKTVEEAIKILNDNEMAVILIKR